MKYVFIPREGDKNRLLRYEGHFNELSDKELDEVYQKQVRSGITGVHAQAVYLMALRKAMIERFGRSPISAEGRVIDLA